MIGIPEHVLILGETAWGVYYCIIKGQVEKNIKTP